MILKENTPVILKSFLDREDSPKRYKGSKEDYWKLLGEIGSVIKLSDNKKKALILFEQNLDDLKLENHNEIKNTLWINITDLEFLK